MTCVWVIIGMFTYIGLHMPSVLALTGLTNLVTSAHAAVLVWEVWYQQNRCTLEQTMLPMHVS